MHRTFKDKSIFKKIALVSPLIFLAIISTSHLWNADVLMHTDIARDFLVLEDMVRTHKPTLLGARAGGISGVFHGPLWYYVCFIPFISVGGNPLGMGVFWWLLGFATISAFGILVFKVTRSFDTSLMSGIALFGFIFIQVPGLTNTFGAFALSVIFFYSFGTFFQKKKWPAAALGWFVLGCIVHFEMAFALPLFLLILPVFIYVILKNKQYLVASSFFLFLLPLLTFVLFDLRHDWLQTRAVLSFLSTSSASHLSTINRLEQRLFAMLTQGWNVLGWTHTWGALPTIVILVDSLLSKNKTTRLWILFYLYLYLGWWTLTLFFKGDIWSYYYAPFLPITFFLIAIVSEKIPLSRLLIMVIAVSNFIYFTPRLIYTPKSYDASSWKLLSSIARDTYTHASTTTNNFGYFLYTQDQYAYPLKYAFLYEQKSHQDLLGNAYQKKPLTYLVLGADDPRNPFITADYWTTNTVRLSAQPKETLKYPFGYVVQRYQLTAQDIQNPPDPNIIIGLEMR